jgi:hypothetical protein
MAVGFWKTPTEATYLAPGDTSQNHHIEGLPLGTRGGMLVRHDFPADGEYKFSIQNFGIGSFIPGEQLEITIDGERAHIFKYQGVGLSQGMAGDAGDGILEVTIPVKAGSRAVGATFLATNYRPSLDMIRQYDRKSLENNSIPQLQYYPAIGFLRIQGPFTAQRPSDSRSMRKVLTCRPDAGVASGFSRTSQEEACAKQILSTLAKHAYRRPVTARDVDPLLAFYEGGRKAGAFEDGIELALRRLLASPQFLVRAEKEPAAVAAGHTYRITDLELASRLSFFLWSSIPDDELIDLASQGRLSAPKTIEQQVRRMLADPRADALVRNFGEQYLYLRNLAATSPDGVFYPDWDDELRQGFQARDRALLRQHHARGPQRPRPADAGLHVRQRAAGAALRHPEHLRLALPARHARTGARLPPRPARQGQLPVDHVDAELPHVASEARRVGAREHPRHAAARAAAQRAGAGGDRGRGQESVDAARADDAAPRQPDVRGVPQDHGPDRLCARQLRRRRQVASEAGRRGRHADRRVGRSCSTASR